MIKTLSAGAIGVKLKSFEAGIAKAKEFGFGGLEFDVREVAPRIDELGVAIVSGLFLSEGVLPVVFGMPVDWKGDESKWASDLKELPRLAKAASAIGCTRTATWVMPGSNDLEPDQNRDFHIARLTPVAKTLADHGISFGLEFIGPKHIRDSQKHPFVYTMSDMLELASAIGPNVGLLFDSYHWHTSGGTLAEVRALKCDQIVYVHLNDALPGVPVDELMDGTRCLPGETGVIDLKGLVLALYSIGYDGPAAVEPFKKELNDLPSDDKRLAAVSKSLSATVDL